MTYMIWGLFGLIYILFCKRPSCYELSQVSPYAICWFLSFLFLFSSFDLIGSVLANLAQSTRGLISVFIGFFLTRLGFKHLEENANKKEMFQRLFLTVVMLFAMGIYMFGQLIGNGS